MSFDQKYIKQAADVKIRTVVTPRIYVQWVNTEKGNDEVESYERIESPYVYYVNNYNRKMIISRTDKFFDTLEELYRIGQLKQ